MFDRDKWQEIFATMKRHKLRTALTAFGVFWGIFMLIFILGMGKGLENGVYKTFGRTAKNVMYVNSASTTVPYQGLPVGRQIQMRLEDIAAIQSNISELDMVAPRLSLGAQAMNFQNNNERFELRGELTDMIHIEALELDQGRYINSFDVDASRKVCVIGKTVQESLFGETSCIGQYLSISGIDFKVVGVFGPMQLNEWTRSDMEAVVIPLSTMSKTFGTEDRIEWFICSAKPSVLVSEMEPKIEALLKERHRVAPEDREAFRSFNLESQFLDIKNLFLGIKLFLWFVGIGTLLSGIVGVSNIMIILVKERTREIGIRKALGATPISIIGMILTESIFLTSLSGYLGLLVGTLLIGGIDYIMISNQIEPVNFWHPEVNLSVGIAAIITLIIAGTIAGLVPAINASKINPVHALKSE